MPALEQSSKPRIIHKAYTAKLKLEIALYAKELSNNTQAAKKYGLSTIKEG